MRRRVIFSGCWALKQVVIDIANIVKPVTKLNISVCDYILYKKSYCLSAVTPSFAFASSAFSHPVLIYFLKC